MWQVGHGHGVTVVVLAGLGGLSQPGCCGLCGSSAAVPTVAGHSVPPALPLGHVWLPGGLSCVAQLSTGCPCRADQNPARELAGMSLEAWCHWGHAELR